MVWYIVITYLVLTYLIGIGMIYELSTSYSRSNKLIVGCILLWLLSPILVPIAIGLNIPTK